MKLKEISFTMIYLITTIFFNSFYVNADVFEFIENGTNVEWTWEDKKRYLIDHMEDLIIDGKNFGKITSAGRKAITENRLDDFYPYCDEEAQTIENYKEYISYQLINEHIEGQGKYNFSGVVKKYGRMDYNGVSRQSSQQDKTSVETQNSKSNEGQNTNQSEQTTSTTSADDIDIDMYLITFITSLIITIVVYTLPMLLWKLLVRTEYTRSHAKIITIVYAIIAFFIMSFINNSTANLRPLVLWSYVNYRILINPVKDKKNTLKKDFNYYTPKYKELLKNHIIKSRFFDKKTIILTSIISILVVTVVILSVSIITNDKKVIAENATETTTSTVYIGKTGDKYHERNCHSLNGNGKAISINEALEQGRDACQMCH